MNPTEERFRRQLGERCALTAARAARLHRSMARLVDFMFTRRDALPRGGTVSASATGGISDPVADAALANERAGQAQDVVGWYLEGARLIAQADELAMQLLEADARAAVVPIRRSRIRVCAGCGEVRRIKAGGLCDACYMADWRRRRSTAA